MAAATYPAAAANWDLRFVLTGRLFDAVAAALLLTALGAVIWRGPSDLALPGIPRSVLPAVILALVPLYFRVQQVARAGTGVRQRVTLIALMQGLIVFASVLDRRMPVPALLLIAIAQLALVAGWRVAGGSVALTGVSLAIAYGQVGPLPLVLATVAFYVALQLLVVLLVELAGRAETARHVAEEARAELQALQSLLADAIRERERTQVARELHDIVGHRLTGLLLTLQEDGPFDAAARVAQARDIATQLLADARAAVRGLDDRSGLALDVALREVMAGYPPGMIRILGPEDLRTPDAAVARTLLRCAQEGVTNAVRHGCAQHVEVALRRESGALVLEVTDDGCGSGSVTPGFGLSAMRARVAELGGSLAIDARRDGAGLTLRAVLPERRK